MIYLDLECRIIYTEVLEYALYRSFTRWVYDKTQNKVLSSVNWFHLEFMINFSRASWDDFRPESKDFFLFKSRVTEVGRGPGRKRFSTIYPLIQSPKDPNSQVLGQAKIRNPEASSGSPTSVWGFKYYPLLLSQVRWQGDELKGKQTELTLHEKDLCCRKRLNGLMLHVIALAPAVLTKHSQKCFR